MKEIQGVVLTVLVCGLMAGSANAISTYSSSFDAADALWTEHRVDDSDQVYTYGQSGGAGNPGGALTSSAQTGLVIEGAGGGSSANAAGKVTTGALTMPAAGGTATWTATVGPVQGDITTLGVGIGIAGNEDVPTAYGMYYNADTDVIAAIVGGVGNVGSYNTGGKFNGTYRIVLDNDGGAITAAFDVQKFGEAAWNSVGSDSSTTAGQFPGAYSLIGVQKTKDIFVEHASYNVVNPIPEPGTLALLGIGGLFCFCRRRRG